MLPDVRMTFAWCFFYAKCDVYKKYEVENYI